MWVIEVILVSKLSEHGLKSYSIPNFERGITASVLRITMKVLKKQVFEINAFKVFMSFNHGIKNEVFLSVKILIFKYKY